MLTLGGMASVVSNRVRAEKEGKKFRGRKGRLTGEVRSGNLSHGKDRQAVVFHFVFPSFFFFGKVQTFWRAHYRHTSELGNEHPGKVARGIKMGW